jgi:pimeloyl-ACP methyl ester carboxylesterase
MYPDEVAGMVLIDPTHPTHWRTMKSAAPITASQIGILSQVGFSRPMKQEFEAQERCLETQAPISGQIKVQFLFSSDFIPKLKIIERTSLEKMMRDLRVQWTRDIPNSTAVEVPDSGHYIQKDQPQYVVDAITQAIASFNR